jgi:hypothetical protein
MRVDGAPAALDGITLHAERYSERRRLNTAPPIMPVDRPYRQIGDPARCAWCGGRAQSGFELYDPAAWVFRLGVCGQEACDEEATKVRSRIGPLQRQVELP